MSPFIGCPMQRVVSLETIYTSNSGLSKLCVCIHMYVIICVYTGCTYIHENFCVCNNNNPRKRGYQPENGGVWKEWDGG